MRKSSVVASLVLLASVLALPLLAEFKVEKGVAAPGEIPAALKDVVVSQGLRVLNDAGAPFLEVWFNKSLSAEPKSAAPDTVYTGIPEGSFFGVVRFVAAGSDCRGQPIKSGFYSLRYALMPMDGAHLGLSQYRDFVLLVPAGADANPAVNLKFDEVVGLSRKASGTGHAASFAMVPPEEVSEPAIGTNDQGHTILKARIPTKSGAGLPVGITIVGKAE